MVDCPSYIGARVMRATRLDSCGRPVYGPDSQVVTRGLISVNIEPSVEEGETFTQRNINGDLCVNEQGEDVVQWYDLSIEFCQVDACLWSIMNPAWKLVKNAHGEITGVRMGQKIDNTRGFALEVWPKVSGEGSLCDDDAPEEADPHGYFLLPYLVGRAPDGFSIENGVTTFTLNARTKKGSLWGRGPYNVTFDADNNPVPLLEPIDSGAGGSDPNHFHMDNAVLLSPPTPVCGCQPLVPIAPTVEGGTITLDPEQPNRACLVVQGSAARQVTLDWGDGSDPITTRVGREECHLYTEVGTYTVTLTDPDDPEKTNSYEVTVSEVPGLPDPIISVTPTSGDAPLSVTLTVNNNGNGQVSIDWGDGTAPTTHAGGTAEAPVTYPHQYLAGQPDPYVITVTAVEDANASATAEVQVGSTEPTPPPTASATPTTGPAPLDTVLTVDNHGHGSVVLDWGDGAEPETVPGGTTGSPATYPHTYTTAGTYPVTVTSAADESLTSTVTITVEEAPAAAPEVQLDQDTGEAPFTASFVVDNHGAGPVDIDPGDGSTPLTNPGDGTTATEHVYADEGEYTATVTSQADPAAESTAEVTVTAPAVEMPVLVVTPTSGQAPLEVAITVDNNGNGAATISPESTPPVNLSNPGDGTTVSTWTFTDPGEYTVTAYSDADPAETMVTETVTVTAPAPVPVADPTAVAVADATAEEAEVAWEWAAGEGPEATGFEVRYRTPAGTGTWSSPLEALASDRSLLVDGLTPATEYEFGVTAVADAERSAEVTVTGSTTA